MKFVDEYRDADSAAYFLKEIDRITTRPWTIMEICGGQTHTIVKNGIDLLLPDKIRLLHGPGCPVCVTPVQFIDKAIDLALRKDTILCSFGDMLRVPGSSKDLLAARAEGGDVRMVYSPLDAIRIAARNPAREVVFFAIGFETTAPANAAAVRQAKRVGLSNFSILAAQVLVPPAIEKILSTPDCGIQGFLAAGHVCTIMGYTQYEDLAETFGVPMVVTGFELLDILQGIYMTVDLLERGKNTIENQYIRGVRREGNPEARKMMNEVFKIVPRRWRGLGEIDDSGLVLRSAYQEFDAECKFGLIDILFEKSSECISGQILQGLKKPHECPAFGTECDPEHPLGATMVSSEGACAAYYHYRKAQPGEKVLFQKGSR